VYPCICIESFWKDTFKKNKIVKCGCLQGRNGKLHITNGREKLSMVAYACKTGGGDNRITV
jgi:hypothetical protein